MRGRRKEAASKWRKVRHTQSTMWTGIQAELKKENHIKVSKE